MLAVHSLLPWPSLGGWQQASPPRSSALWARGLHPLGALACGRGEGAPRSRDKRPPVQPALFPPVWGIRDVCALFYPALGKTGGTERWTEEVAVSETGPALHRVGADTARTCPWSPRNGLPRRPQHRAWLVGSQGTIRSLRHRARGQPRTPRASGSRRSWALLPDPPAQHGRRTDTAVPPSRD